MMWLSCRGCQCHVRLSLLHLLKCWYCVYLACMAYLMTFSIDMMCTRVSCDDCLAIGWFICILILFMSFVVAVPVSQLRASPRKGSKLLLQWMCVCDCPSKEGLDCNNLLKILWLFLPELYMPSIFENSTCRVDSSWVWTMVADPESIVIVMSWRIAY